MVLLDYVIFFDDFHYSHTIPKRIYNLIMAMEFSVFTFQLDNIKR